MGILRALTAALLGAGVLVAVATAEAPPITISGAPAVASESDKAEFAFMANVPVSRFECRVDGGEFSPCSSPASYTGLTPGGHAFEVRAVDGAGATGPISPWNWTVTPSPVVTSLAAPSPPLQPRVVVGDGVAELSWRLPARATAVVVTASVGDTPPRLVFRGAGTSLAVPGLRNGVEVTFTLRAISAVGVRSSGIVVRATPMPAFVASPAAGAHLRRLPLLRWRAFPGASYYNVQLFRGKKKVFSAWPSQPELALPRDWFYYDGKWRLMKPGAYTWYVWPGLGKQSDALYTPLLGKRSFVVRR